MQLDLELMVRLNDALASAIGHRFEPNRLPDLEKALLLAGHELGYHDVGQITQFAEDVCRCQVSSAELEALARHLTVGETYFFRDPKIFAELKNLLPELLKKRQSEKVLRIWSAGCCSGEEAYSLAMLVTKVISASQCFGSLSQWQIEIYGSDINRDFLDKAESGIYSAWSFRGGEADQLIKAKFFTATADDRFIIADRVKKMVQFSYLNLADDYSYLDVLKSKPLDLVLCRNVLIYFATSVAGAVLTRLSAALADDGWLLLANSDLPAAGTRSHNLHLLSQTMPLFERDKVDAQQDVKTAEKTQSRPQIQAEKYEFAYARRLLSQGEYQNSERVVDKALKSLTNGVRRRLDSRLQQQFLELKINLLLSLGRLDEACHQASLLVALDDRYQHLYLFAMVLQQCGDLARAEAVLLQAIEKKSDFGAALLMYSSLLKQKGDDGSARHHLIILRSILLKLPADQLVEFTGDLSVKELLGTIDNLLGEYAGESC